jgi:threonine dehydratase
VRPSLERIARAARDIDPVFRGTPQFEADALGHVLGARIVTKVETINPIRSFKGRGTDFFMRTRTPRPARVVCASAGNFGQGMAYASRKHGVDCEVFAAEGANPLKVERMRALGARVRLAGSDFDDAKAAARAHAAREGAVFVEDGREAAIAEGAGTIGKELAEWPEPFAALLIPLGNGALLGGIAAWFRWVAADTRIVGVAAARAPAMERSWRSGTVIETERADTIADGIAVRVPVPEALESLRDTVDDILLVEERSMLEAMRVIWETIGLIVEPAGAAGVAALVQHRDRFRGGLIGTVLCGANVTRAQMREWQIGTEV